MSWTCVPRPESERASLPGQCTAGISGGYHSVVRVIYARLSLVSCQRRCAMTWSWDGRIDEAIR